VEETISSQLGDIVVLTDKHKSELRERTIDNIKIYLKTPSIAEFQENFTYTCEEANVVKVEGYVDSQNSFGSILRGKFICEYFVINGVSDTLVYIEYNNEEIFNIKDTYIEEYKKQDKLDNINKNGNELNQEKLDYIMNEFNSDEINDVGRVKNAEYKEDISIINIDVIAKKIEKKEDKQFWIYHNIIAIIDYIKQFENIGTVQINLYINEILMAEAKFDEQFIEEVWKDNTWIDKVPKLLDENYIEMF